jgi:hypothetical protein
MTLQNSRHPPRWVAAWSCKSGGGMVLQNQPPSGGMNLQTGRQVVGTAQKPANLIVVARHF